MEQWPILVLSGFGAGFLAGAIGLGAIVLVPLLVFVAGLPIHAAAGASIANTFAAAVSALVAHRRRRRVHVRIGLIAAAGALVGGGTGGLASALVSGQMLTAFYLTVVLVALALVAPVEQAAEPTEPPRGGIVALSIGLTVGLIGGMIGVGGGFIQVPLLVRAARMRMHEAVGTSLFIALFGTAAGFSGKLVTGQVPFPEALIVLAGGMTGGQLGARLSGRFNARVLRGAFALVLLLIAARVAADLFGWPPKAS
ncbi:MAG: sulfite exporter TauE/SafE family protein [Chloroflexi bacterium]|nr:sulfite exporter TauE/SafE family protein [Chloroflexota bacterium]